MTSTVHLARPLPATVGDGASRMLLSDPTQWLPADSRRAGLDWTLVLRAGRFHRRVRTSIGAPVVAGDVASRSIGWQPLEEYEDLVPVNALPGFTGRLEVTDPHDALPGAVVLAGRYSPPGGAVGRGVDALVMRLVARHTLTGLLAELFEGLAQPPPSRQGGLANAHR